MLNKKRNMKKNTIFEQNTQPFELVISHISHGRLIFVNYRGSFLEMCDYYCSGPLETCR